VVLRFCMAVRGSEAANAFLHLVAFGSSPT
jgi:hypothetical protein